MADPVKTTRLSEDVWAAAGHVAVDERADIQKIVDRACRGYAPIQKYLELGKQPVEPVDSTEGK